MLDKHGVFTLKGAAGSTCRSIHSTLLEGTTDSGTFLGISAFTLMMLPKTSLT